MTYSNSEDRHKMSNTINLFMNRCIRIAFDSDHAIADITDGLDMLDIDWAFYYSLDAGQLVIEWKV